MSRPKPTIRQLIRALYSVAKTSLRIAPGMSVLQITGSAITKIIESHCVGNHPEPAHIDNMDELKRELYDFVSVMKSATILGE